jgi:hypothetical protein
MELAHQMELARLQAQERQKERDFQKEEQKARLKAARLQAERLMASSNAEKVPEAVSQNKNSDGQFKDKKLIHESTHPRSLTGRICRNSQ